jgi:hypothetical protein
MVMAKGRAGVKSKRKSKNPVKRKGLKRKGH